MTSDQYESCFREEDEERHRVECELTRHKRRSWPHRACLIARACLKVRDHLDDNTDQRTNLLQVHQEGYEVPDRINKKRTRCFKDLVDRKLKNLSSTVSIYSDYVLLDYDDVTKDISKVENDFWYKDVSEILGALTPPREEFISIYGRLLVREHIISTSSKWEWHSLCLEVNSFALRADNNGEEENVGTALYRANSIFDHSCTPNATTIFSGKHSYWILGTLDPCSLKRYL